MAEAGDLINEFKNAKPPEKALIIVAVFAVIGIALYWRAKSAQSQGTVGAGGPTASTGSGSPFPTVSQGQIPVLPQGVNPVYDSAGNVVAYGPNQMQPQQQNTVATQTPTLTTVQTRGLWAGQSFGTGGGVPVFNQPNVTFDASGNPTNTIGGFPLLNDIQIGQATHGNYAGKPATYYPVTVNGQQGYIGSWDLANPPQAGAVGNPHGAPPRGISYHRKVTRGTTLVTATYSRRGRQ